MVQPSEVLHKKPILVERGSFRPATKLTLDLLERAREQFLEEPSVAGQTPVVLAEMTLRSLDGGITISTTRLPGPRGDPRRARRRRPHLRFEPYYELAEYLAAYTDKPIGLAVGHAQPSAKSPMRSTTPIARWRAGVGGRLFKRSVTMYVYPTRDPVSGDSYSVDRAMIPAPWHHLRTLLLDMGRVEPIRGYDETLLTIQTPDVLRKIESGDPSWEEMVPGTVADIIKAKHLFGWRSASQMSSQHAAVPA